MVFCAEARAEHKNRNNVKRDFICEKDILKDTTFQGGDKRLKKFVLKMMHSPTNAKSLTRDQQPLRDESE
jgi:hypothetical protein